MRGIATKAILLKGDRGDREDGTLDAKNEKRGGEN
jgi:hypothetical protein